MIKALLSLIFWLVFLGTLEAVDATSSSDLWQYCNSSDPGVQWGCKNGTKLQSECIQKDKVCDGTVDCDDKSDEKVGCRLFPAEPCRSLHGIRHVVCVDEEDIEVCTTETLLKEYQFCDPESADCNGNICRKCGENEWRCDNGECIKAGKRKDGFPDCKDGSDERRFHLKWRYIFASLIASGVTLLILVCLWLNKKIPSQYRPTWCSTSRDDTTDSARGEFTNPLHRLPMELIGHLLEDSSWNNEGEIKDQAKVKELYVRTALLVPVAFKNLHLFITVVSSSLNWDKDRALRQLNIWDMEIIDSVKSQDISAVLQYYHQQLGNSYLLQKTIGNSRRYYAPTQGGVLGWVKAQIRFLCQFGCLPQFIYGVRLFVAVVKSLGSACLFYAQSIFSWWLYYLIGTTLCDIANCDTWKDKIWSVLIGNKNDESLEYLLNFLLLLALAMTYTIYGLLSASEVTRIYRPKTSDDGKLKKGCLEGYYCDISSSICRKEWGVRLLWFLATPFIPALLLAQHARNQMKLVTIRRRLGQEIQGRRSSESEPEDPTQSNKEEKDKEIKELFIKYQSCSVESEPVTGAFNHFRVVQASLENFFLVCTVLLTFVMGSPKFRSGVAAKFSAVLNRRYAQEPLEDERSKGWAIAVFGPLMGEGIYSQEGTHVAEFLLLPLYALLMSLSAFVRAQYHAKQGKITILGQVFFGIYCLCMIVSRLSAICGMIMTTKNQEPAVSLPVVITFAALLTPIQFVICWIYKHSRVPSFKNSEERKRVTVAKFIHILVNSLIPLPFPTYQNDLEVDEVNELNEMTIDNKERAVSIVKEHNKWSERRNSAGEGSSKERKRKQKEWKEDEKELWNVNIGPNPASCEDEVDGDGFALKALIRKPESQQLLKDYRITTKEIPSEETRPCCLKAKVNQKQEEVVVMLILNFLFNCMFFLIEVANGGYKFDYRGEVESSYSWQFVFIPYLIGLLFLYRYYSQNPIKTAPSVDLNKIKVLQILANDPGCGFKCHQDQKAEEKRTNPTSQESRQESVYEPEHGKQVMA